MRTYGIIKLHGLGDAVRDTLEKILTRLLSAIGASKAEVSHNVKDDIVDSVGEVDRVRPFVRADFLADEFMPLIDVLNHKVRRSTYKFVCEAQVEKLALLSVSSDVNVNQGVDFTILAEGLVEAASTHIALHAMDLIVCLGTFEQHSVGLDANCVAVDFE